MLFFIVKVICVQKFNKESSVHKEVWIKVEYCRTSRQTVDSNDVS